MKSVEEQIKEFRAELDKINQELEVLEMEKQEILKAFEKADERQRKVVAKEMQASERRFRELYEQMISLSAGVKKLKKAKLN